MFTYKDIDNLLLYTFRINRYDFENNFDLIMVKHKDMKVTTHIMNEITKYTKKLIEKERDNPKLVVKDKHIIFNPYVNSKY